MSQITCTKSLNLPSRHWLIARTCAASCIAAVSGSAVATCGPALLQEGAVSAANPDYDNVYGQPSYTIHTSYRGSFGYGEQCYNQATIAGWLQSSDSSDRLRVVVDQAGVFDGSLIWANYYNGALVVNGLAATGTTGFPMQVTLALESDPTYIAASFSLASSSPQGSYSGTINPGIYTLTISGLDPAINASGQIGSYRIYFYTAPAPVPEPSVSFLFLAGLVTIGWVGRRRDAFKMIRVFASA